LPSRPHGLWLEQDGEAKFLGAVFSDVPVKPGTRFWRGTAGGGGYGDPLARDPEKVRQDVEDDYVSVARARRDYGVVVTCVDEDLAEYEVDYDATVRERAAIAQARRGWLEEDPEQVAARFRAGEIDVMDALRRYGVILNWGTGELYPKTTADFRAAMKRRSAAFWG
jgi:N-methylhydantoinase B